MSRVFHKWQYAISPMRELLARAVESNGGYTRHLSGSWPLSWEVPIQSRKSTFDELFDAAVKQLRQDHIGDEPTHWTPAHLKNVKFDWNSSMRGGGLFYQIAEDMRNDVQDSDTFKFMRPEIEKRYGLSVDPLRTRMYIKEPGCKFRIEHDYPRAFDVEFEFVGRGGKHLVISAFEGRKLVGLSAKDLAQMMRSGDGAYSNAWCRDLLAMVHEWDLCFTPQEVESSWESAAAGMLARRLLEIHEQGSVLELRLDSVSAPVIVDGEVRVMARIEGKDTDVIFQVNMNNVGGSRAVLLANIFKEAVEAHLDVHG
jgi:hypothetical protein